MSLLLPTTMTPFNLNLPEGERAVPVESDVYDICERIAEISPDLRVHALESNQRDDCTWAITEQCKDGVERLVFRCGALDGRVIRKLNYLLHVPLEQRVRELEADAYKFEQDAREEELNVLYERLGGPMQIELERCGFTEPRSKSYPKRGVAQPKRSR